MKALITGASGFIGKHLVKRLLEDGNHVKCLVRKNSNIEHLNNVEFVYGDLRDKESLKKAVRDVDIVYHLGAVLGSKAENKKIIWEVNVEGTRNLLEASFNGRIKKFIFFSSFLVYGYTKNAATEETPYTAETTYYGESKRKGEEIVEEYKKKGMNTVIVQPSIIHGPGLDFGFASLFPAVQKGRFLFIGGGNNLEQLGYIDNLIDGVILAAKKNNAIGQKYIIGDSEILTFNEIVNEISNILNVNIPKVHVPEKIARISVFPLNVLSKITGINPPLDHKRINFMTKNQAGSIEKAKRELGYKPKISSKEGLRRTIEHFRKTGFLK